MLTLMVMVGCVVLGCAVLAAAVLLIGGIIKVAGYLCDKLGLWGSAPKTAAVVALLFCAITVGAQEKTVSIPESQLTEQQKQALKLNQVDSTIEKAHGWVGIGKELGQAFDSALGSLTARSNEFASTKVGKFTMFIVAWKVMGEQAGQVLNAIVHIIVGMLELAIFVPWFIWSYRRSCIDRRLVVSREGPFWARKKTYQVVPYEKNDEFTTRHGHCITLAVFVIVWAITTFSY